jgi:hypothetical protein
MHRRVIAPGSSHLGIEHRTPSCPGRYVSAHGVEPAHDIERSTSRQNEKCHRVVVAWRFNTMERALERQARAYATADRRRPDFPIDAALPPELDPRPGHAPPPGRSSSERESRHE